MSITEAIVIIAALIYTGFVFTYLISEARIWEGTFIFQKKKYLH